MIWLPLVNIKGRWQGQNNILGDWSSHKRLLYQWQFLPFGLKNTFVNFQNVMDQVLACCNFAKCHIDDIIIFSLTLEDHMHNLPWRCLEDLRVIILSFIQANASSFKLRWNILVVHDLSKWIGGSKGQSWGHFTCPNQWMLVSYDLL